MRKNSGESITRHRRHPKDKPKRKSGSSSSSASDSDNDMEICNLISQSRSRLENVEALRVAHHLLRPEDYVSITPSTSLNGFTTRCGCRHCRRRGQEYRARERRKRKRRSSASASGGHTSRASCRSTCSTETATQTTLDFPSASSLHANRYFVFIFVMTSVTLLTLFVLAPFYIHIFVKITKTQR